MNTTLVDLLVVGRRGRGLSARVLGSVSADIVEHSPVPVLVVEPVDEPERLPGRRTSGERAAAEGKHEGW